MSAQKKTGLYKQLVITSLIALAALGLIISYFAVFSKMRDPSEQTTDGHVLLPGEVEGLTDRSFYIYQPLSSDDIQKITVTNQYGTFSLTHSGSGSSFYIDEDESATYDDAMFATLVVAVGNTITRNRVFPADDHGTEPESVDLANYGLDEAHISARFTVTARTGESYTMRVGDPASSGEGYYVYLEGRNAVYILGNDIDKSVLGTVENIVTPLLVYPMSTQDFHTVDYFSIWKQGEHFLTIHYMETEEEAEKYAAVSNYLMTCNQQISSFDVLSSTTEKRLDALLAMDRFPYSYTPAIDEFSGVLEDLVYLQGDQTVAIPQSGQESITTEQLLEFGITPEKPALELFFNYQGINNYVVFSEKDADGNYYAYSPLFDLIVRISEEKLNFLDWSFSQWVESSFVQKNIKNIKNIELQTDSIHYSFELEHSASESGADVLTVRENGQVLDTDNFRQFYKVLLTRDFRDSYTQAPPDENTLYMTLRITTDAGVVTEYRFYQASTQRLYMTIDGQGEFYVLSSVMRELESDAIKVATGQAVDAYDRK